MYPTQIKELILKLEQAKTGLADCKTHAALIAWIDNTMEAIIDYQRSSGSGQVQNSGELVTRLRYLREIRAAALELSEEQISDFSRDFSLIVSSMQFQLWQGKNSELLSLLDKKSQA